MKSIKYKNYVIYYSRNLIKKTWVATCTAPPKFFKAYGKNQDDAVSNVIKEIDNETDN